MGKAARLRRERAVAATPVVVLSPVICQCPGFIGPHEETESCRRMQRMFDKWLRKKMR